MSDAEKAKVKFAVDVVSSFCQMQECQFLQRDDRDDDQSLSLSVSLPV